MSNLNDEDNVEESFDESTEPAETRRKKRPGELIREGSLMAAPTLIIVYPLVGFGLGWLCVKYLGWPWWVPLLTMMAALVQAIREVTKLAKKVYKDD